MRVAQHAVLLLLGLASGYLDERGCAIPCDAGTYANPLFNASYHERRRRLKDYEPPCLDCPPGYYAPYSGTLTCKP